MESRKNKMLGRLGLAAAVSAYADQQFGTHSHRISLSVSLLTGYSSVHTAGGTYDRL